MPTGPKPPLPPSTGRVAISGVFGTSSWTNVFHVLGSEAGTPTLTDWGTIVQGVLNAYQTNLMPLQSTGSTCQIARGVYIPSAGTELVIEKTSTTTGGHADAALPAQCSAVLSWQISAYYRGGKPRTYIPGLTEAMTATVKTITSTYQTAMTTGGNAFLTAVNALTTGTITPVELITVAFARNNVWLTTPLKIPITGVSVHTRLDSQRRRLGKETS